MRQKLLLRPSLIVAVQLILYAVMIYSPWGVAGFLIIPFAALSWGSLSDMLPLLLKRKRYIVSQFACAWFYYLVHAPDILRLELWSDEILTLKIADGPFSTVGKAALNTGVFPPYFYWETHLFQYAYKLITPSLMEFVYRIPSMIIHAAAAILFSIVVQMFFNAPQNKIRTSALFTGWLAFFAYFFNPLLFPYAFEVRPYSLMAMQSVALGALWLQSGDMIRVVPFQVFSFMTSFFHVVLYAPRAIIDSFRVKSRSAALLTVCAAVFVALASVPVSRIPNQTTAHVSVLEIFRAISFIRGVFFPNIVVSVAVIAVILISLGNSRIRLIAFQAVFTIIVVIILARIVRYQAFAPRHVIIAIPLVLFTLFASLASHTATRRALGLSLMIFFAVLWGVRSEQTIRESAFAPKIQIGIKKAIHSAFESGLPIVMESKIIDPQDRFFLTSAYLNEESTWYLRQYGIFEKRLPHEMLCGAVHSDTVYVIAFQNQDCFTNVDTVSVLSMQIREPL